MDKAEKKLAKKLLDFYQSSNKKIDGFSREENIILERWRALKMLNEDAFHNMTSHGSDVKEFVTGLGFPFTLLGYKEYKKNWYIQFREGELVTVIRDVLTVVAFSLSLYLALVEVFIK